MLSVYIDLMEMPSVSHVRVTVSSQNLQLRFTCEFHTSVEGYSYLDRFLRVIYTIMVVQHHSH